MRISGRVRVVEVGPRDGLQNESQPVPADTRAELIERLADAGLPVVEAGSFVSAKWVPQMADTATVLAGVTRRPGTAYPVLVPNREGYGRARAAGATEIAVFAAASETFSHRNTNCSIEDGLDRIATVCDAARDDGVAVRGYVSCVMGCPYEGDVPPDRVARVAERLRALGCAEISLGDTIGIGTAGQAQRLIDTVARLVPVECLAAHFHDTYGQALANLLAVMEKGIAVVDSAVAGLGGCPYAPGAAGNVATEDVLYMLHGLDVETGVDLDAVAAAGVFICGVLQREPASRVSQAMAAQMQA